MGWLISVLGLALAVAGAVSLANGISYIRLDWGSTEVIAGTVALAGGLITLALGTVLLALRDLARRTERAVVAPVGVGMEALLTPDAPTEGEPTQDTPAQAESPRPTGKGRIRARLATVGLPKAERAAPSGLLVEESTGNGAARDLDAPLDGTAAMASRPSPATGLRATLPAGPQGNSDTDLAPSPAASASGVAQVATAVAETPTVVGRYDANGASYVLFSDGTIEVETETGMHRFSSMADLKSHIERQDAG